MSSIVARLRAAGCVYAEEEAALLTEAADTPEVLEAMLVRRTAGVPIEHVVGWAEFCGLRLVIEPGVFVPRRRTELLARLAAEAARNAEAARDAGTAVEAATVVDLCCGCGALGAAVATAVPGIRLLAADLDPSAVRCARRNLAAFTAEVHVGDLFEPLPDALRGTVAVLVANVPYVPSDEIPLLPAEARDFEPHTALDGGLDGLAVLRRVVAQAPDWLAPGGQVLFETSTGQVPTAIAALRAAGLTTRVVHDEELHATVVTGGRAPLRAAPAASARRPA